MSYQRDGGGRQAIPTTSRQGGSLLEFTVKYVQCRSRKGAASEKGEDARVGAGERAGAGEEAGAGARAGAGAGAWRSGRGAPI